MYNCAVVCWPVKEIAPKLVQCDPDVKALDWQMVFDIKDWLLIPTVATCPMYAINKDIFRSGVSHYMYLFPSMFIY